MSSAAVELNNGVVSAVLPWFSTDANAPIRKNAISQQRIEICLNCQHCAEHCEECREWSGKTGRPKKQIDTALLREMLTLRACNEEMCAALGVSTPTLIKAKKQIFEEDNK